MDASNRPFSFAFDAILRHISHLARRKLIVVLRCMTVSWLSSASKLAILLRTLQGSGSLVVIRRACKSSENPTPYFLARITTGVESDRLMRLQDVPTSCRPSETQLARCHDLISVETRTCQSILRRQRRTPMYHAKLPRTASVLEPVQRLDCHLPVVTEILRRALKQFCNRRMRRSSWRLVELLVLSPLSERRAARSGIYVLFLAFSCQQSWGSFATFAE